jgi:hypothetical protein
VVARAPARAARPAGDPCSPMCCTLCAVVTWEFGLVVLQLDGAAEYQEGSGGKKSVRLVP